MDWLRFLVCCLLPAGQCCFADGQFAGVPGETSFRQRSEIAVVGDVAHPDTYACPAAGSVSLREVVNTAGLVSERSSAAVIRSGGGTGLSTEVIERSSVSPGMSLRPGDIVVIRAAGNPDITVQPNAALQFRGRLVVLSLQGNRVSIGDVLAQLQISPDAASTMKRAFTGTAVRGDRLQAGDLIGHGEVVLPVANVSHRGPESGRLVPAVSEWIPSTSPPAVSERRSDTNGIEGLTVPNPSSESQEEVPQGFFLPSVNGDGNSSPNDSGVSGEDIVEPESSMPHSVDSPGQQNPFQLVQSSGAAPLVSISDSVTQPAPAAPAAASVPAAASDRAPLPPDEFPIVAANESGFSFWQAACVVLMLAAAGLMLSARSQGGSGERVAAPGIGPISLARDVSPVQNVIRFTQPAETAGMRRQTETASQPAETARMLQSGGEPTDPSEPADYSIESAASAAEDGPVAGDEWFGGDWRRGSTYSAETGIDAVASAAHEAIDKWSSGCGALVDTMTSASGLMPEMSVLPESNLTAAPELKMESDATTEPYISASGFAAQPEFKDSEPTEKASIAGFSDLTALIENRLPVDLMQARLPLRISLFGRAAGPRRLRVDAAHSTLAGPHTFSGAERRGAAAYSASAEQLNVRTSGKRKSADNIVPEGFVAERNTESLDRALTFLQEQGDR